MTRERVVDMRKTRSKEVRFRLAFSSEAVWVAEMVLVGLLPCFSGGGQLPNAVIAAQAQEMYIGTAAYLIEGCLRRSLKT